MLKQIIPFIAILLILACESREVANNKELNMDSLNVAMNALDSIRFEISANRINDNNIFVDVTVNATLFNDKTDTIYFLTMTCFGEQNSLRYDTTKFERISLTTCAASNPVVRKIAPNGQYSFKADFKDKTKVDSITLGFDLYQVDKAFIITTENMNALKIFNRPADQQKIIWAKESIIH